jgi:hypothetical protein
VQIAGPPMLEEAPGSAHVFEANVTNVSGTVIYQWEKKEGSVFQPLPGGNKAWYVLEPVAEHHAGIYRCSVTDNTGSASSNVVILSVIPEVPVTGVMGIICLSLLFLLLAGLRFRRRLQT